MQRPSTVQGATPIHGLPPPRNNDPPGAHTQRAMLVSRKKSIHETLSFVNRECHLAFAELDSALEAQDKLLTANKQFADAQAGWMGQSSILREENGRLEKAKEVLAAELDNKKQSSTLEKVLLGAEIQTLKDNLQEIRDRLNTRDEEVSAARTVHEHCEQSARDLNTQLETKNREIEAARTLQNTSERTIEDLRAQLETNHHDLDTARATQESFKQIAEDLRDMLAIKSNDLDAALRKQKEAEKAKRDLGNQLAKRNDSLTAALAASDEAKQGMQVIRDKLEKLKQDAEQARQTAKRMEMEAENYRMKLENANQAATSLRKDHAAAAAQKVKSHEAALATAQGEFDEQIERLEAEKRQESEEKQTAQRELAANRQCRQQIQSKLRLLRMTLADVEAAERAASLRNKVKSLTASECDNEVRESLSCQSYVLEVVCEQARSKQKLNVVDVGEELAQSLARDLGQQNRRLRTQKLEKRNRDLETELGTVKTKGERSLLKSQRLERAMRAMMEDGDEKDRVDAAINALNHAGSREESVTLSTKMTNEPEVRYREELLVTESSRKRSVNGAGLDEQGKSTVKKARIDESLGIVSSAGPDNSTYTAGVTESIAVPSSDGMSAHQSSGQEQEDAVLGLTDETSHQGRPDANDDEVIVTARRQSRDSGQAQHQASNDTAVPAASRPAGNQTTEREYVNSSSAAHDLDDGMTSPFPTSTPGTLSFNSSDGSQPAAPITSSPTRQPHPMLPPGKSPNVGKVVAGSTLPPPEYESPPLPPPPEDTPGWTQKRVSFSKPVAKAENEIAASRPQLSSSAHQSSTSRARASSSSEPPAEATQKADRAPIKFALPRPAPSANHASKTKMAPPVKARRTPIQPQKDFERQQKRLAQASASSAQTQDSSTQPSSSTQPIASSHLNSISRSHTSTTQTNSHPLYTNPPTSTDLYGRRESTTQSHDGSGGRLPPERLRDDSDEGRRAHRQKEREAREELEKLEERLRNRPYQRWRLQSKYLNRQAQADVYSRGRGQGRC